ncbi:hypothetical protein ACFQ9X_49430 [Catenulispora yoronensis]
MAPQQQDLRGRPLPSPPLVTTQLAALRVRTTWWSKRVPSPSSTSAIRTSTHGFSYTGRSECTVQWLRLRGAGSAASAVC